MLSFFRWVLFFIALFVTLMGGGAVARPHACWRREGPLDKTKNIVIPRGAGPATMAKVLQDEGVIAHDRAVPRRPDDRSRRPSRSRRASTRCRRTSRWRALVDAAAVGQGGAAPPHRARGHHDGRGRRAGAQDRGADRRDHARRQGRRPAARDLFLFARRHARRRAVAHEGGDGQDARRGVAQARRRACRSPASATR